MRLILLGAPGVGKGTQGALLAKKHDLARIATGDLLRDAVRRDTTLGRQAKRFMDAGELVPDDLILDMVREVLAGAEHGFVLDGFPRTLEQATRLDELLDRMGMALDAVVVIEAPDDMLVKRISGRRSCPDCGAVYNVYFDPPRQEGTCDRCGATLVERADDAEETVRHRLDVYRRQTQPLVEHYRQSAVPVEVVDGRRPVGEVHEAIRDVLAGA